MDDLCDPGRWNTCSKAYLQLRFDVNVWEHPFGIGDCDVPLEEACQCYLEGDFLHPIERAHLVWAMTRALSRLFETGTPTNEQLALAERVALDAQHRPWAIAAIDCSAQFNEQVDPGDYRVDRWLRSLDGLDFEAMRHRKDEYFHGERNTEVKANSVIVGPYNSNPEQQD